MEKNIDEIKEGMKKAKKDLVSSMVVTTICIKKLEGNIQDAEKLLSKFQI